jgi:heptosyltransferase-2
MNREPTSILAFRNGSIGNTLVAIPALRALRQRYPRAVLSVVVDPIGHELLRHTPWIDHLITYDKRGRDRGLIAQIRLVRRLRALKPSHAILFKRFFRNGLLAYLSGARVRAGFRTGSDAPFLNLTVPYQPGKNVVDLNLQLAGKLGADTSDRTLQIYLTREDQDQARRVTGDEKYMVFHYGGQTTSADYFPRGRFVSLAADLGSQEYRMFFIGAGSDETQWARDIVEKVGRGRVATDLPVRVTGAMIESAALFVGFNSGPAHLAAAVGTPELVIFRPDENTDAEIHKWAPVSDKSRVLVPPATSNEKEWRGFVEHAVDTAMTLMRSAHAMSTSRL